jgi:parvulin-like peptidyl-prolyl isomerase
VCYRQAAAAPNELVPRTPADVERALSELARGIADDAAFAELCAGAANDDADSRRARGDLGWVTRSGGRLGRELADLVFAAAPAELPEGGALLGPFRTSKGAALVWARARRASPPWSEMSRSVVRELVRRLMQEALPADQVHTWLDE